MCVHEVYNNISDIQAFNTIMFQQFLVALPTHFQRMLMQDNINELQAAIKKAQHLQTLENTTNSSSEILNLTGEFNSLKQTINSLTDKQTQSAQQINYTQYQEIPQHAKQSNNSSQQKPRISTNHSHRTFRYKPQQTICQFCYKPEHVLDKFFKFQRQYGSTISNRTSHKNFTHVQSRHSNRRNHPYNRNNYKRSTHQSQDMSLLNPTATSFFPNKDLN